MPGYRAHLVGGVVAYGISLYLLKNFCSSTFVAAEWLLFSLVGSLFPDIDIKGKAQKMFYQFLIMIIVVLAIGRKFVPIALISLFAFIPMTVKHRGLFHRWWFLVSVPLFVVGIVTIYIPAYSSIVMFDALFFIGGALSHLLLDFGV